MKVKNNKKALRKELYMEIKNTLPRFVSILLIVALGVAFFSGLRATNPDMKLSADVYYDTTNLMDIRVLGSLGLTDEDAKEILKIEGVKEVTSGYVADVLSDRSDSQLVLKLISSPDSINTIELIQGRLPESVDECLMDTAFLEAGSYKIGDTITVASGTEDDIEDIIAETTFTIVGFGNISYYLSLERGTSTIGNGTVDGFVIIPKETFSYEAYTEIHVTVEGAIDLMPYTDEYDEKVDQVVDRIEEIADARSKIRYEEVAREANGQITDGETEIADAIKKLEDAKIELEDGEKELADARIEIEKNEKKLKDSQEEIRKAETKLDDGAKAIEEGYTKLNEGKAELISGQEQFAYGKAEFDGQKAFFDQGKIELENKEKELMESKAALELQKQNLEVMKLAADGSDPVLQEQIARLEAAIPVYEAQLKAGEEQIAGAKAQIQEGEAQLAAAEKQINEGQGDLIQAANEIDRSEKLLDEKQAELQRGYEELNKAKAQLEDGKNAIEEAKLKLADGEEELAEGRETYEEEKAKADKELAKANKDIEDAKEAIATLEIPEWFVLDRQYLQTYVEYGQDSERIGAIGEVFPAIFFLVAALVSLTTMTRMVEEERLQIGTLKALGYSKWDIAKKYIIYALMASLIGSVIGFIVGQKLLPTIIINAYGILYNNLPKAIAPVSFYYSITSTILAVACTTIATVLACYKELMATPAKLMRPAAPKAGKRVLLERIPLLWKRLNFTGKSTVRNLIRYKKRFFMTIFGIGGCMALLLVGFGVNDSIMLIGNIQFGEIRIYDGVIGLKDDITDLEKEELYAALDNDNRVIDKMYTREMSIDVGKGKNEKSAYLVVPEKTEELGKYVVLKDRVTDETHELTKEGVIITEKLAALLDIEPGDSIYLKDGDTSQVETIVTGVTENYFIHYVYMSSSVYEELYGDTPVYNEIMTNYIDNSSDFESEFRKEYLDMEGVSGVTLIKETAKSVENMLESMDIVILVLIMAAGMLAFVVLYNLNNINISERKRELATLKVLGFYNKEVAGYVYRENVLLTLIGSILGIFMGILLHRFVIVTAETDIMMFGRNINTISFIYSMILTFLFSAIVNFVMYYKLKKIDMIESLKSVE